MENNNTVVYAAGMPKKDLKPGEGLPVDSLNCFDWKGDTGNPSMIINIPKKFSKKLREKFKNKVRSKISEIGGTHTLGEDFILKCFDDALIETLLEE